MATATLVLISHAFSQTPSENTPNIPNFFDPQDRLIRPSLKERPRLRFLTVTDFPPFSFIDPQKRLAGFHVELARAICEELELQEQCQIQALPYDELESALNNGTGDALLAGIPIDAASRERFSFSLPYFRIPARFAVKSENAFREPLIKSLAGKSVGIIDGTAHAAFGKTNFGDMKLRLFDTQQRAFDTLEKGEIDAVFSDALSLSFWLQGKKGNACCEFIGEPYLAPAYFGRGLSIAVQRDDLELRDGLDFALKSINANGKFAELYLRYFPISLY
ncbi:MAG: transporter substrate-binding domain-containing protein [Rhizobiaceae bacterium]